MSVATAKKPKFVKLTADDQETADTFIESGKLKTEHEKAYKAAKKSLEEALGDSLMGRLPDGRIVTRKISHCEAATIERAAYDSSTITITG